MKSQASVVSSTLTNTIAAIDRAIATAQQIRAASLASDAATLAGELLSLTSQVGDGLRRAEQDMRTMMKAEGL